MVDEIFPKAFSYVLGNEGGYSNDPNDPGGETKYGISDKLLSRIDLFNPSKTIKDLTLDDAKLLYKRVFWDRHNIGKIKSDRIAIKVFDSCVNIGPSKAIRMMQKIIGATKDGICGPETIRLINKYDEKAFLSSYVYELIIYYASLHNGKYFSGWLARANKLP